MALGGASGGGGSARGIRAGSAFVELGVRDNLTNQLSNIKQKFNALGATMTRIGGPLIAGGAGVAGGLLGGAVPELQDLTKLNATAQAFGLTAEAASGLFGVMKASGSDIRDATEGLVTLGQRVSDAMSGSGEQAAKLFEGLGISAKEFDGLDPAEQFYKLHDALRQVSDPAKRVQLLLQAVGEDTGKNLIGTLSMTTAQLRAQAAGFAVTSDEMRTATEATAAYNQATGALSKAWQQVALATAPAVKFLAEQFQAIVVPAMEWAKQNKTLIATVALVATAVAGAGAALVGIGGTIAAVGAVGSALVGIFAAIKGVVLAVISPVGLAIAGLTALGVLFATQTSLGREWVSAIGGYFAETLATIKSAWGGISDALQAGDMGLAWRVGVSAVNVEWQRLVQLLSAGWQRVKSFFVEGWIDIVAFAKTTFLELADETLWGRLLVAGAAAVSQLGRYFTDLFQGIKDQAIGVFQKLAAIAQAGPFEAGRMAGEWLGEKLLPIAPAIAKGNELKQQFDKAAEDFGKGIALQGRAGIEAAAMTAKAEARAAAEVAKAEAQSALDEAKKGLAELNDQALRAKNGKIFSDFMAGDFNPTGGGKSAMSALSSSAGFFSLQPGFLAQALGARNVSPQVVEQKTTNVLLKENNALLDRIASDGGLKFT